MPPSMLLLRSAPGLRALLALGAALALSSCIQKPEECIPACGEQICGREFCGHSCGTCPKGTSCAPDGRSCLTLTQKIGSACERHADCGEGRTCLKAADGVPGGYCTAACGAAGACPAEAVCGPGPDGKDTCLAACSAADPATCRTAEGYACTAEGFCPTCVRDCGGRVCGSDGCGGTCGDCNEDGTWRACDSGACVRPYSLLGSLPRARWDFAAVSLDGYVYLLGGREAVEEAATRRNFSRGVDWVERYDPLTQQTHSERDPGAGYIKLPRPLALPHAAAVNGHVYIAGGTIDPREPGAAEAADPGFFRLEPGGWQAYPDLPEPSRGGGLVGIGNVLYYFVGATGDAVSRRVYSYQLPPDRARFWQELTGPEGETLQRLVARSHFAIATDGTRAYLLGGTDGTKALPVVEIFDPATGFSRGGDLPVAVQGARAIHAAERIFVFGGSGGTFVPLQAFDPRFRRAVRLGSAFWQYLGQAPAARPDSILLFGGVVFSGEEPFATADIVRYELPSD